MRIGAQLCRPRIPFRSVNRRDMPGYDPHMQRHHLLPRQIMGRGSLRSMIHAIDARRIDLDDFRENGMLLPAREDCALAMCLPLHRGPHRRYNDMVLQRVGAVEKEWSANRMAMPVSAGMDALMRLSLLQRALRRRLLDTIGRRMVLNRRDPFSDAVDFSELDAMADALWGATDPFSESLIVEIAVETKLLPAHAPSAFAALSTARTLAVATSGWMPTPQTVAPSSRVHST